MMPTMPPGIARLDRDQRGRPIPYIVQRDPDGHPNFVVNEVRVVMKGCVLEGRCSVCGEPLAEDDIWFVGGPLSGLDPRGAYNDPPVHHDCASFAMQVCPYLANRRYSGMADTAKQKLFERIQSKSPLMRTFEDPTMIRDRPATFIVGRATGYVVSGRFPHEIRFTPNRPFAEVEEWRDGTMERHYTSPADMAELRKRGLATMKADKVSLPQLSAVQRQLWLGKGAGITPWSGRRGYLAGFQNLPEALDHLKRSEKILQGG